MKTHEMHGSLNLSLFYVGKYVLHNVHLPPWHHGPQHGGHQRQLLAVTHEVSHSSRSSISLIINATIADLLVAASLTCALWS
jgi:hypothetical protein